MRVAQKAMFDEAGQRETVIVVRDTELPREERSYAGKMRAAIDRLSSQVIFTDIISIHPVYENVGTDNEILTLVVKYY